MVTISEIATRIAAYEAGAMAQAEIIDLFQDLVDSGFIWHLQGSYVRTALALGREGFITFRGA